MTTHDPEIDRTGPAPDGPLPSAGSERVRTAEAVSIARTLRAGLILAVIALAVWLLADIATLIFAAVLAAVVLRGASDALSSATRLPNGLAFALVGVALAAAGAGFVAWLGPQIEVQLAELVRSLMHFLTTEAAASGFWGHLLDRARAGLASHGFTLVGDSTRRVVVHALGGLSSVLLIFVTALYLGATPGLYVRGFISLVPIPRRPRGLEILAELTAVLRRWMFGQLIDMMVVGVLASVGLSLLHVPMALALGVLAGVLTFIPYIGAFIAAIPGVIVAANVGLPTVIWVIVVYLACHLVEGYLVSPLVNRQMIYLPPALTVFSMVVLGYVYGPLGVILATPMTACGLTLVKEIYVRDMLGDHQVAGLVSHEPDRMRHAGKA
ncbi:AI-2E family transporter [Acidiphilium acidophilum]|uniref:AI-2E family transporter n=1 Tax=Acidiphilium acidophilum TaxID=76588 RepID=UPI002E8E6385|nr:AI-2E family transporter [Acidiphilium acidophilum]